MGEHDPLRNPSRSGCVDQCGDAVRNARIEWLGVSGLPQRTNANRTKAVSLFDHCTASLGMISLILRCAYGIEDTASATVIPNLFDLARRETGVHQYRPGVDAGRCQKNRHEGSTILAHDHDAIARPHVQVAKP